jgi:hypothetical protein
MDENGETYGSGTKRDAYILPDGRMMTKQCFWLNREYIAKQIQKGDE